MKMKPGDIIALTFHDHMMESGDCLDDPPPECEVFGKLVKETRLCYVVATWIFTNNHVDHNTETFKILKKTVIKREVLRCYRG